MRPLQTLLKCSSLALLCFSAFACVDDSYDLKNADYDVEILKEGISLPIGTMQMTMDSILKDVDASVLKVQNDMYTFYVGDEINVSNMLSDINGVSLSTPVGTSSSINLVDATDAPSTPYNVPVGSTSYSGNVSITLPDFSTDLISVDSVLLKNSTFTMTTSVVNIGGSNIDNCISITCTPVGNAADYYIDGVKVSSWTVGPRFSKVIEIRKIRGNGATLAITGEATITVNTLGELTATAKAQTKINVGLLFSALDFETVFGKVTYSTTDSNTQNFEGFGDLLGSDNVLSFHNPTMKIQTTSNLGVPIKLSLNLSTSNTTTSQTASISGADFTMLSPATPAQTVTNTFTLDRDNGTDQLFKINPDKISVGYTIQADPNTSNHFINKNTTLIITDTMEIPIQFNEDLVLNVGDTLENPFLDIMDQLAEQDSLTFGFLFDVENRIPLSMQIRLTALDADNVALFTVESGTISAAKVTDTSTGLATDTTLTTTYLSFTSDQVNQFKDIPNFKFDFIVTTGTNTLAAIQPSDYIKINVGAKIAGGVLLDLNKKEE
jgi:hypothetical protein